MFIQETRFLRCQWESFGKKRRGKSKFYAVRLKNRVSDIFARVEYLRGTSSSDGNELDVWRGSLTKANLDAVVCTADLLKKDAEIKLLLGCTEAEKTIICDFHNDSEYMAAILLNR